MAQQSWVEFEKAYELYKKYGVNELEKQLQKAARHNPSIGEQDVQAALRLTLQAITPDVEKQLLQVDPQLRQHHQPRVEPEHELVETLQGEVSPGQRFKEPKWAKFDFAPATKEIIRNIARQLAQDPNAGKTMTAQYDKVLKEALRNELQNRLKAQFRPAPGQKKKIEPRGPY